MNSPFFTFLVEIFLWHLIADDQNKTKIKTKFRIIFRKLYHIKIPNIFLCYASNTTFWLPIFNPVPKNFEIKDTTHQGQIRALVQNNNIYIYIYIKDDKRWKWINEELELIQ